MQLTFLGAAGTVTGSKYLISLDSKNILVDCGLYQGRKELRLRNWAKLPINPARIDAVVLTHAHIDHSGYLPRLVKQGFTGPIYCTPATKDLCAILLTDSGHLQEQEANLANRYHYSKHSPAQPLYTEEDAVKALRQFKTVGFDKPHKLFNLFDITFYRAGHILGASFLTIKTKSTSLLFTGDMGRPRDPIMREPAEIKATDYLVVESTYGDRLHEQHDPQQQLKDIINRTVQRGGSIVIPAFAVGRAQTLLYYIHELKQANEIADIPVFLDSPMAINATELLCKYSNEHKQSRQKCAEFCHVASYVNTVEESKQLDNLRHPAIIISASGMATGGRILFHLRKFAPDPKNTVLFTGYQAVETRGARILRGEAVVKMLGEMVPINAEIAEINSVSAHADYQEMLIWLAPLKVAPKKVFITHGEPEAAISFKDKIENKFGWQCEIPHYLQQVTLE